jgi:hypothetical protein
MSAESNRAQVFAKLDMNILEQGRKDAQARGDMAFATDMHRAMQIRAQSQTPDAENSGILVPHYSTDEAGRRITKFTGDQMTWMGHFMTGGQVFKVRRNPKVLAYTLR